MIELRQYQIDGLNALWNYFQSGKTGNPLLAWPTGTGKSICPAIFIKEAMRIWPTQKFMLLTHVKELIQQNADVLLEIWPEAPLGVYSAGLNRKEIGLPIIYAGIQSAIKNPAMFGHRDIIFIDEAHLVSGDQSSMYITFIATMKLINPHVKIIGMSATPFRMGMGYITDGGLFTDIVHDVTSLESFNKLVDEGYIAPLIPKRTKTELDVSNVGVQNGEFKAGELQIAVDKNEITYNLLREAIEYGHDRKSWLAFASGIDHAEHMAETLNTFGINAVAVHSKRPMQENDNAIQAFKNFEIQAIVNFGKLTTGFNHPEIDLIIMARPTLSVPLWVQMLGRGTRPAPFKENCLVLDYARNTPRLGAINDPIIPRKKGEKGGDAPIKICDLCGVYNHAAARVCCNCGEEFIFKVKIVREAGTEELIKSDKPVFETYDVSHVIYAPRQKLDRVKNIVQGPAYVQVTYVCNGGFHQFKENVFPEHGGFVSKKFRDWWKQRHTIEPPSTSKEVLEHISSLRCPKKITVHVNRKYPDILSAEF